MDQPSTSGGERDEGSGAGASDLERLVGSQDILSLMFQQMAKNRKLTVLDDASTASTSRSPTFAARDWIACRLVCKQWKEMTEVRGATPRQISSGRSVGLLRSRPRPR